MPAFQGTFFIHIIDFTIKILYYRCNSKILQYLCMKFLFVESNAFVCKITIGHRKLITISNYLGSSTRCTSFTQLRNREQFYAACYLIVCAVPAFITYELRESERCGCVSSFKTALLHSFITFSSIHTVITLYSTMPVKCKTNMVA